MKDIAFPFMFFFFRHHSIITSVFASYTSKWMTCGKNPEPGHITSLDHDNFSLSNLSMDLLFTFFYRPSLLFTFYQFCPDQTHDYLISGVSR